MGRNSRLHTAPVGARTYGWIYELDGELRLTAYQHVLIATIGSRINNRLYPVERWISLLNWKKVSGYLTTATMPQITRLTGKHPFARRSSSATGIRRSVDLGGTGRAGGTMTSSYSCKSVSIQNIQKHYAVRTDFKMFPLSPQRQQISVSSRRKHTILR